jgi:hypothetical protein
MELRRSNSDLAVAGYCTVKPPILLTLASGHSINLAKPSMNILLNDS